MWCFYLIDNFHFEMNLLNQKFWSNPLPVRWIESLTQFLFPLQSDMASSSFYQLISNCHWDLNFRKIPLRNRLEFPSRELPNEYREEKLNYLHASSLVTRCQVFAFMSFASLLSFGVRYQASNVCLLFLPLSRRAWPFSMRIKAKNKESRILTFFLSFDKKTRVREYPKENALH